MIIAHEINYQRVKASLKAQIGEKPKLTGPKSLPKQFNIKLVSVINASPAEVSEALSSENLRPLWEPKLREVKKEANGILSLQYVGYTTKYQRSFDFEQLKNVGR